jgi:hypothetical protein
MVAEGMTLNLTGKVKVSKIYMEVVTADPRGYLCILISMTH